ncbi:hypothetical protein HMPREF0072_0568, partial [Anaerococcus lactolyticus ATCC 51172]
RRPSPSVRCQPRSPSSARPSGGSRARPWPGRHDRASRAGCRRPSGGHRPSARPCALRARCDAPRP